MISFRVDLGEQCVHLSITVVNRDDCCQDRFKDATFLFLDENQETVGEIGDIKTFSIGTSSPSIFLTQKVSL